MSEAATIWRPTGNQEGEYDLSTAVAIVDPSAVALVDPSAIAIFDTGVSFTPISSTVWTGDDSA